MKIEKAHCSLNGDYSSLKPRLRVAEGGRFVQLRFARSPAAEWNAELFGSSFGGVRGVCKGFSASSRRRMMDKLNTVSCAAPLPSFVTLTYPDACFDDDLSRFAKRAKSDLDAWLKRLRRVEPLAATVWKLEFEARKSGKHEGKMFPHFHLLVWGCQSRRVFGFVDRFEDVVDLPDSQLNWDLFAVMKQVGRVRGANEDPQGSEPEARSVRGAHRVTAINFGDGYLACDMSLSFSRRFEGQAFLLRGSLVPAGYSQSRMSLQDWAALAWYHVVESGDLNHFSAGVRVEKVRTWGGVVSYASKYMAKPYAEFLSALSFGRSWGVSNRACIPWAKMIELELPEDIGVRLRRVARRYLEHVCGRKWNAPYGVKVYCDSSQFLRLLASWESPPF